MSLASNREARGERPRNSFSCFPFSRSIFERQVRALSEGARTLHPVEQVGYLARYLSMLGAVSLLVETHYIDRHFIEEVSLYYSRCLLPKRNSCARIHVFHPLRDGRRLDQPGVLDSMLERAALGAWDGVNKELSEAYLGFIVVRPLPSVPIGRTVLVPPVSAEAVAHVFTVRYTIHMLGFEIPLEGVAFQQQDRAVGACATAAIWMALQRTCKNEGDRPPTPSAVTEAAVRYFLPSGRSLPSSGLTIEQICEALRYFEFPPEVLNATDLDPLEHRYLRLRLHVYLRSGMPIILAVDTRSGGHAVAVVGYRAEVSREAGLLLGPKELRDFGPEEVKGSQSDGLRLKLANLDFDHLYLHDDRLGPYVLAQLETKLNRKKTRCQLSLRLKWPEGKYIKGEELEVLWAAVPLYPKLRSAAHELLESAVELLPLIRQFSVQPEDDLGVELFFCRSGHYLKDLHLQNVDPGRLNRFLKNIALSRYVGIVRWLLNGRPWLDTVWDTTDRLRETRFQEHLLGMISFRHSDWAMIDRIGAHDLGAVVG